MAATQVGHLRCRLGGSRPSTLRHGAPARAGALVAVGRRVGERGKELVMLYRCCSSGAHSTSRATPHSSATTGSRQHTWTQAVDSRAHPSPRRAGTINSATHSLRSARIQSTAHTRTHTLSPGFSPTWVATVGQRSACICRQPAVAGGHITLSIAAEPEQARDKHAASSCEARADDRANLLCQAGPLRGHVRGSS